MNLRQCKAATAVELVKKLTVGSNCVYVSIFHHAWRDHKIFFTLLQFKDINIGSVYLHDCWLQQVAYGNGYGLMSMSTGICLSTDHSFIVNRSGGLLKIFIYEILPYKID